MGFSTTRARCVRRHRAWHVHQRAGSVLEELQRHAAAHVLSNGLGPGQPHGALVSARQLDTVKGYLQRGGGGAEQLQRRRAGLERGHFIQPSVFLDRAERTAWPAKRSSARCSPS